MGADDKVSILLVDDQPGKLLSYEAILGDLGEKLLKAASAREALAHLLRTEVALILVDVCMPELDGFELAAMIREHPRFQRIAIIFVSEIHLSDLDRLRGYDSGAVDYVPVPVVPEILRAKVKVFVELYRTTRELERVNRTLEQRVLERTAALQASTTRLLESEQRRTLALAAGRMGSWEWDLATGACVWDEGQYRIFGLDPAEVAASQAGFWAMVHPDDSALLREMVDRALQHRESFNAEFRIRRASGELRWCVVGAAPTMDDAGQPVRLSGITYDITDRKRAEERQQLLVRELNHRVKNTLATVQSIAMQTARSHSSLEGFHDAFGARLQALARAHDMLTREGWAGALLTDVVRETLAPYRSTLAERLEMDGPRVHLVPNAVVTLNMALHELATNAAKYGALSDGTGRLSVTWRAEPAELPSKVELRWVEQGGPPVMPPERRGFGSRLLEDGLRHELDCEVALEFLPAGVACLIQVPLSAKVRLP